MQRDTDFLIRRIYDAVDNVDALPDVLSGLCERIGGENGILGILMKTPGPLPFAVLFRLDPSLISAGVVAVRPSVLTITGLGSAVGGAAVGGPVQVLLLVLADVVGGLRSRSTNGPGAEARSV